jgi:hypothetical protein
MKLYKLGFKLGQLQKRQQVRLARAQGKAAGKLPVPKPPKYRRQKAQVPFVELQDAAPDLNQLSPSQSLDQPEIQEISADL